MDDKKPGSFTPHSKACRRLFLHRMIDPDCKGCVATVEGKQPRMTKKRAFAFLKKKGFR